MAVSMMRRLQPGLDIRGAGTFSIPGLPMSQRTREALSQMDLADPHHRSHQLENKDCDWADLIVVFESEHVDYIRRNFSEASCITGTLPRLAKYLRPSEIDLASRIAGLQLAEVEIESWEEVEDPAGGDQSIFDACAREINVYVSTLAENLNGL